MRILCFFLMALSNTIVNAQNPYNYINITVEFSFTNSISSLLKTVVPGGFLKRGGKIIYDEADGNVAGMTVISAINEVVKHYNDLGYHVQSVSIKSEGANTYLYYIFETSSSPREKELYALINEVNKRIDIAANHYTDSAMAVLKTTLLNYLKSIPTDIIAKEFKDNLTQTILDENKRLLREAVEEVKKEVRRTSSGNQQ